MTARTIEDYSSFSWEVLEKAIQDMIEDVKKQTGASDEEIALAFHCCALKFTEINFLKLGSKYN